MLKSQALPAASVLGVAVQNGVPGGTEKGCPAGKDVCKVVDIPSGTSAP